MKKIILILLFLPITCSGMSKYFSDMLLISYDPSFSIQKFFKDNNCFLKDLTVDGKPVAFWMEQSCRQYHISQRFFIAHEIYEQSILDSKIGGGKWFYPSGEIKSVKYVLMTFSGVSGGKKRTFHLYYGFKRQVDLCCQIYRREFDAWKPGVRVKVHRNHTQPRSYTIPTSASAYALLKYTPYFNAVSDHKKIYFKIFSK